MNRKQIKNDQIYGEFGYIIRFFLATNDSFGMTIKSEPCINFLLADSEKEERVREYGASRANPAAPV